MRALGYDVSQVNLPIFWNQFEEANRVPRFSGTTAGIQSDISRVDAITKPFNAGQFFFAQTRQEDIDLWSCRKEALWTMTSIRPDGFNIWSTDVAVPISRLTEIISESQSPKCVFPWKLI